MKRYITRIFSIVTAVMALLWSSCTADNDHEPASDTSRTIIFGQAMVAQGGTDRQSSSRSMLLSALSEGAQMKVYGYCVPRKISNINEYSPEQSVLPWVNKADFSVPDVFEDKLLTVKRGRPVYDNLVSWYTDDLTNPNMTGVNTTNCRYTFMSYYPATGAFSYELNNAADNNTTGAPRFIFRMSDAAATNHDAIPDAMVAAKFDHLRDNGQVNFTYQHILTALRFQINNYASEVLHIHSLNLSGTFFKEAKFDFDEGTVKQTTTAISAASFNGSWSLLSATMDVAAGSGRPLGDGTRGTSVMLLPNTDIAPDAGQEVDCLGRNKKIKVTYSLGDGERKTTETELKLLFKPVAGTSYALNLNFVGDEFVIYFNPTDLWEHGSDNDIEID